MSTASVSFFAHGGRRGSPASHRRVVCGVVVAAMALLCGCQRPQTPPALTVAAPPPAPGLPHEAIRYTLDGAARVSVNIYAADGQVVRELRHAAPRPAGPQTEIWDGLDEAGAPLPPGEYAWKLLATPGGLRAEYLLSLGSNYPKGDSWRHLGGPGCHATPGAVAADDTGVYVAARTTENIETGMLKLSPDGQTRLWSAMHPRAWDGALSLAVDGGELFLLGHVHKDDPRLKGDEARRQLLYVYDATTGRFAERFLRPTGLGRRPLGIDVQWDPTVERAEATAMDARHGVLVVAYRGRDAIRWYDPQSGERLAEAPVPSPEGVAVGDDGTVFVTSGGRLLRLSRPAPQPVELCGDLAGAGHVAFDAASGGVLVYLAETRQVARVASDGRVVARYGAAGGRVPGLYDATALHSFAGVNDLAADGAGGFYVAEDGAAPRRVAHFDPDGKHVREWYGGQPWAAWAAVEPDNPQAVWMASGGGDMMRLQVDYARRSVRVHSTYRLSGLGGGLVPSQSNATLWEARLANGELYLCRIEHHGGDPVVVRVDRSNWRLVPATVCLGNLRHRRDRNWLPPIIRDHMGAHQSMQWNDANGDGTPQPEEITWHTESAPGHGAAGYDRELHTMWHGGQYRVTAWLPSGAPVYGTYPRPEPMPDTPPGRVNRITTRWGAYFHRDPETGDLYGAYNDRMPDWGRSEDSFMVKWDSGGARRWTVGRLGGAPGRIWRPFRRIAGMAHGCIVATGFSYEYGTDGTNASYVWDRDGLWVGGVFDDLDLEVAPEMQYALGGEALVAQLVELADGEVLFFGGWISEVRVFRISGWEGWRRASGTVTIPADYQAPPAPPEPAATGGTGLLGEYYRSAQPAAEHLAFTRLDPTITFAWGRFARGNPATTPIPEFGAAYSVRWTGWLVPPVSGLYAFQPAASGIGRITIGDTEYGPPYAERGGRANYRIRLAAGKAYPVAIVYSTHSTHPAADHGIRLQWLLPGHGEWRDVPTSALHPPDYAKHDAGP